MSANSPTLQKTHDIYHPCPAPFPPCGAYISDYYILMSVPGDRKFKYTHNVTVSGNKFYLKVAALIVLVVSLVLIISLKSQVSELKRVNQETQRRLDRLRMDMSSRGEWKDTPNHNHGHEPHPHFIADKLMHLEQTLSEMQKEQRQKSQMIGFKLQEIKQQIKKNQFGASNILKKLEEYQYQLTGYLQPMLKFLKTWF